MEGFLWVRWFRYIITVGIQNVLPPLERVV